MSTTEDVEKSCRCLVTILISIFTIASYYLWCILFPKPLKDPKGYQKEWFGKDPPPASNDTVAESSDDIRPFKINVPDEVLQDLKSRLERTRYADPVHDSKFQYGFNPNYLRKVVDYWRNDYDWRKQEEMLNQFPQFKTRIEGIDVHFLHVKPKLPEGSDLKVLPLMIIHGWPGSVVEFHKIIPMLTTPRAGQDFVFEVIAPSIPGYGFSEAPHRKGFTIRAAARVFQTLMERLGHQKFYVQGGGWGSVISNLMARYYPSNIRGVHLNMYFNSYLPWEAIKYLVINFFPSLVSEEEYRLCFPLSKLFKLFFAEGGHTLIQRTKPDSVGAGITDSPAGMAAYMLEKFAYWTNPEYLELDDGGLTKKFTLDELLTNVMLYWVNNNFTSSVRFYKENMDDVHWEDHHKVPLVVPSAVAVFPNEHTTHPKTCMSQQVKNLVSYTMMPRGGHFAAFEEPELLADDVWKFVSLVEK